MTYESIANQFGCTTRSCPAGTFIAEKRTDGPGKKDDAMLVKLDGQIVVYEHNAQAYLAAKAISAAVSS